MINNVIPATAHRDMRAGDRVTFQPHESMQTDPFMHEFFSRGDVVVEGFTPSSFSYSNADGFHRLEFTEARLVNGAGQVADVEASQLRGLTPATNAQEALALSFFPTYVKAGDSAVLTDQAQDRLGDTKRVQQHFAQGAVRVTSVDYGVEAPLAHTVNAHGETDCFLFGDLKVAGKDVATTQPPPTAFDTVRSLLHRAIS